MESIAPTTREALRRRQRLTAAIKQSLRELGSQLALLNRHVGARVELKDVDYDCLDLIAQDGPLSPSALARRAGLHPATLTGILDRLERGGWVARERDPADRRVVRIRALHTRNVELVRLYAGMNSAMDRICAGYAEAQLQVIAEFLERTAHAGGSAAADLAGGAPPTRGSG